MNPGGTGSTTRRAAQFGTCDASANPTDPNAGDCRPGRESRFRRAKRIFRGIELVVRKQFTNEIWAQVSYLGSSLTRQLLRRDPRGLGPDGPRHQRRLRLHAVPRNA